MTTIKIVGTADEIETILDILDESMTVRSVSKFREDRSEFDGRPLGLPIGRVYVEVEL